MEAVMAFQRRMQSEPDSVSDEEIQAEYGPDISPGDLRELFRKSTFGREPKNPRVSARAKLRRRLLWLSRIVIVVLALLITCFLSMCKFEHKQRLRGFRTGRCSLIHSQQSGADRGCCLWIICETFPSLPDPPHPLTATLVARPSCALHRSLWHRRRAGDYAACVEQKLHPRPAGRQLPDGRSRPNGRGFFALQ